jgi:hypothetical protein
VEGGIKETSEREGTAEKNYPKLIVELLRPFQTERLAPLTGH